MLVKTEPGHTIVMDDKDGEEFLKIIDRAGQVLHMYCPVKAEVQSENTRRRGTHDSEAGESDGQAGAGAASQPVDIARDIKAGKAFIQVTALCRQFVRLEAWQDREKIHIQSSDKTRSRWQKILIDTTKGRESSGIWGLGGAQEVRIISANGSEQIRFRDRTGSKVIMDGSAVHIVVRSTGKVLFNP